MDNVARAIALLQNRPDLAEKVLRAAEPKPRVVSNAAALEAVVRPKLEGRTTEAFVAVALNRKLRVIGCEIMTTGSDQFTVVCPRQIFRWALLQGKSGAHAIAVAHNHPSGDPTPSPQDHEVTRRLTRAGREIGIAVIDHMIITDDECHSMAANGEL
jgi:DNA repair protein RadC